METHTHIKTYTITHTAGFPFKPFYVNSTVVNQKEAATYDKAIVNDKTRILTKQTETNQPLQRE